MIDGGIQPGSGLFRKVARPSRFLSAHQMLAEKSAAKRRTCLFNAVTVIRHHVRRMSDVVLVKHALHFSQSRDWHDLVVGPVDQQDWWLCFAFFRQMLAAD